MGGGENSFLVSFGFGVLLIYPGSALRHGALIRCAGEDFLVSNRTQSRVPDRRLARVTHQMMPRPKAASYLHKGQRFNLA